MQEYFSVSEAAKAAGMTSETLRHYDRIGLVKPSKKDEWTKYRYYTKQDIVLLDTVHALQQMDLPLQKIKEVLEYDNLEQIINFLQEAEQKADEKIVQLQYSKAKIQLAKRDYENKLRMRQHIGNGEVKRFPKRVILLSDTLEAPTLDNLWGYLTHFYDQIAPSQREQFAFEDAAGIYTENGVSRLFAICARYTDIDGLKILPAGDYLCANCSEENREEKTAELIQTAIKEYHSKPQFTIQQVIVSGILQWNYQVQVYIGT
ncbi:MerR family transcriptional regulator [Clostridium sp. D33t1_170424_F3]|uniref:MerR family transcriptional regulator n=1 Tax=Clostridium sp. D33t1_170424_F3 TaxID=2787099 RepID=UPI0018A98C87|nr:MerR family transcriptional regulator [Clostridium sp. D33t1_170424_F3]